MGDAKRRNINTRKWIKITLFIAAITLIFFTGAIILNKIVENTVTKKLSQLSPVATISYSSIKANFFASRLSINDLTIKLQPGTGDHLHQHLLRFSNCKLTGINFLNVVFNQKLFIKNLQLEKGNIQLDTFLFDKTNLIQNEISTRIPFKEISINQFQLAESNVWLKTNVENKLLLKANINLDKIEINHSNKPAADSLRIGAIQCTAKDISYNLPDYDYSFQIRQLQLDSKRKILKIDSLKILNNKLKQQPAAILAFFSSIDISGIDILKLYDKQFVAGNITIDKSRINRSNYGTLPTSWKQSPGEIRVDSILLTHSSLISSNLSLEADKIAIGSVRKAINKDITYSSVACHLSNIRYSIPYRSIHIKKFTANSKNNFFRIDSLSLATQYSKYEFGKKLGHQADYIEAMVPAIEISTVNFKELINNKLMADKVTLSNPNIYFFRDRRLPRSLKEQPMLNDYLQKIPIEVRLNTFKINNAFVVSEEYPKDGNHTGFLKIEHITMSMSPVITHPAKHDPRYSDTYVEGSIMGAGLISATIRAPLRENIYQIKGAIKNLELTKLNPTAENLGQFHIESGILNHLDFHFKATEEKATGEIIGEYHELLIDRLKQKNGENRVAKIPTFFLKHLIIPKDKDSNMDIKKRTGKIDYKRDPTRMVSFYFLKALLDGIRSSFGFGFLLPK